MTSSQQYADLADDAYRNYKVGNRNPGEEEKVAIDGAEFKLLEHVNNKRNGYQGSIYQRIDPPREIVVAHRGTEFDQKFKDKMQDGALADGGMVLARINAQAGDAVELTRRALEYAEREGKKPGSRAPEVTVTGHSLGGCLAQITAHHFGLKGETFNAYGAVSLSMRIPEGGDTVINHVMAGDPVSAASKHFGQVRVYATQQEIERLVTLGGYENNRSQLDMRSPGPAVVSLLGSHSLHHFRNVDGNGRPDHSVLIDPHARELAEKFAPMIGKYRNDTAMMRSIVTVGSRGQYGAMMDGIDHLRGPLPPGQPAAREASAEEAWAAAVSWKELNGIASPNRPLVPSASAAQPYTPESTGPNGHFLCPITLNPMPVRGYR